MSFDSLLIHTLNIQRHSGSSDEAGGFTRNYHTIATVRGRIRPTGSAEINLGDKWDAKVSHVAYLRPTDIRREDRIQFGAVHFRVVAVHEPSRMGHHFEVILEQIQIKEPRNYGEAIN